MRILLVADAPSMHTRRWVGEWVARGYEVHVASFRAFNVKGTTLHVLPSMGLGKAGYMLAIPVLRCLAIRLHPEIVHAQYVTSYGFLAAAAGLHPLVVTAWGTDVLIDPWRSRWYRYLAEFALARADAVTTVAEHMNRSVEKLGVQAARIQAVPFGVDVERFAFRPRNFVEMERPWRIICTRNFEPVYDVSTLIEAVALLRRDGVVSTLTLVGNGSQDRELRKLVEKRGLTETVQFTGWVNHDRLPRVLADADIFVTPAHSDGNNISLNEAMAAGCFPVATSIPANNQWLEQSVNGYLYPAGDATALAGALRCAVADPDMMNHAIVLNRRIVVEQASWKRSVAHMESLYNKLITKS